MSVSLRASLALGGTLLLAGPAVAATDTDNMAVSATVTANCTISAGALTFGPYEPVVGNATDPLNGTATLAVACTNGSTVSITLGQGVTPAGSDDDAPLRRMTSGGNFLSYDLFSDAGRSVVWGNTIASHASYTGNGGSQNVTVYGRVPGGQQVPVGTYTDTVVATISF